MPEYKRATYDGYEMRYTNNVIILLTPKNDVSIPKGNVERKNKNSVHEVSAVK